MFGSVFVACDIWAPFILVSIFLSQFWLPFNFLTIVLSFQAINWIFTEKSFWNQQSISWNQETGGLLPSKECFFAWSFDTCAMSGLLNVLSLNLQTLGQRLSIELWSFHVVILLNGICAFCLLWSGYTYRIGICLETNLLIQ